MPKRSNFTESQEIEICKEYESTNCRFLARKYKCRVNKIRCILVRHGVELKSRSYINKTFCSRKTTNDDIENKVFELYSQNFGDKKIARELNLKRHIVQRILKNRKLHKSNEIPCYTGAEVWKDIPNYDSLYQASNWGGIRSLDRIVCDGRSLRGINLRLSINDKGYLQVTLSKGGYPKTYEVQRLIARTFMENPNNLPQVNHRDGNPLNNHIDNLEFTNQTGNQIHAYELGLQLPTSGSKHGLAKLNESQVLEIREKYTKGFRSAELAKEYQVTQSNICQIIKRKRWTHI